MLEEFKNPPIVALESTIITHGKPYPQNLETAVEVEQLVRSEGVTPATIAILDRRIKVGLSSQDLKELASTDPRNVIKCSRRNLPFVVGNSLSEGTTVAGTMIIANMVGFRIFATDGIDGVHQEGENTMDVSADLVELGRTTVCVVSSGVKLILNIPRSLEYLKIQGVCVTTFGSPGGRFPDFYTTDSGCTVPYNADSPEDAAKLIQSLIDLELESGMLVAVPVPVQHAMNKQEIDEAIQKALLDIKRRGIEGKAITPFLLPAISKLTQRKSLISNTELIRNNAKVAAQIAKAYSKTLTQRKTVLKAVHEHFHCILLTLGAHGVIVDRRKTQQLLDITADHNTVKRSIRFYPTDEIKNLVNVSGAGDSFSSGFIGNMLRRKTEEECISLGLYAAKKALQSDGAVPKDYFNKEPILDLSMWKDI